MAGDLSWHPGAPERATVPVVTLAAVTLPARWRDAAAEAATMLSMLRRAAPGVEVDAAPVAERLVALLVRLGVDDGRVTAVDVPGAGRRWRVHAQEAAAEALARRLGTHESRGLPTWVTAGSVAQAVAAWRGALLACARLGPDAEIDVPCPTPQAATALGELALLLGVHAHPRRRPGAGVRVTDPREVALLLASCGGRATLTAAAAASPVLASAAREPAEAVPAGSNDARATVAARRATTAAEEAFVLLAEAGVAVPDVLADAGRLRLAHPDLGLAELAALADPPLSKDTLAGRLRRLAVLAARHRCSARR